MCQANQDLMENPDLLAHRGRGGIRECPDQTESVNQGWTANQDNQAHRVAKDNQVNQGCPGNQVYQESANQDTQDQREIRDWEASQVLVG